MRLEYIYELHRKSKMQEQRWKTSTLNELRSPSLVLQYFVLILQATNDEDPAITHLKCGLSS